MKTVRGTKRRGSILIIASLFTFLSLLAAFTLFKVLPVEFNAAKKSRLDISAHYALDAGVKDAIAWLESQPARRIINDHALAEYNSTFGARSSLAPDWEHETTLEQIETGHYGITSKAYFRNRKVREAKVQIVREGFERYALFIDHWRYEDEDSPLIYGMGENLITGPFHTNDFFMLAHQNTSGFDSGDPFVSGPYAEMSHARTTGLLGGDLEGFQADGNAYALAGSLSFNSQASAVPFNEDGALEDRYQRIVEGGRGSLSLVPSIDFPNVAVDENGVSLREKAKAGEQFDGVVQLGVYVPTDDSNEVVGGVYVVGNAEIELDLLQGNQVQRIKQQHLEEAYFVASEQQVTRPRYVARQTSDPPAYVTEIQTVYEERNVIVGYDEPTVQVTSGDGLFTTSTVQSPIYGTESVPVQRQVQRPYDPARDGSGPFTVYVEDHDNPIVYTTTVLNPITEDEYDPNNPNHTIQFQPAGDREYDVVEVTEDALDLAAASSGSDLFSSYDLSDYTVTGGSGGLQVEKGHTVVIDHEEKTILIGEGNTNGITFVDGNVKSLKGVNKGAVTDGPAGRFYTGRTIAAAPEFNKKVTITDHILQFFDGGGAAQGPDKTLKVGELPPNAQHALGIIGHDVELKPSFTTTDSSPLNIYAVILAGFGQYNSDGSPKLGPDGRRITTGGFGMHEDVLTNGSVGRFHLYGGIIQGNAKPWFTPAGGLEGSLIFDPAAAAGLQNFPTTQSVRVVRYSEYVDYDD